MKTLCKQKLFVHRARQFYIANMHGASEGGWDDHFIVQVDTMVAFQGVGYRLEHVLAPKWALIGQGTGCVCLREAAFSFCISAVLLGDPFCFCTISMRCCHTVGSLAGTLLRMPSLTSCIIMTFCKFHPVFCLSLNICRCILILWVVYMSETVHLLYLIETSGEQMYPKDTEKK